MEYQAPFWKEALKSTLKVDAFDQFDYHTATVKVPGLSFVNGKARLTWPGNPGQDMFLSLVKDAPELKPEEDTELELQPLRKVMELALESPNYQALHEQARGNALVAAYATKALADEFLSNLPEHVQDGAREVNRLAKCVDQAAEEIDEIRNAVAWMQGRAEEGNEEHARMINQMAVSGLDAQQALELSQADLAEAVEAVLQDIETARAQIVYGMQEAAEGAGEEAADTIIWIRSFTEMAGGDPGSVDEASAKAAMEILQKSPQLKEIAKYLGWAKRVTKAAVRLSPYGGHELVGFEPQALEVGRLAGQELAALAGDDDDPMYLDAERRLVDGALLHRVTRGESDDQGKGPMVLIRDESGSMGTPMSDMGTCHAVAVAIEWALLEIAREEKREFYCIPFSGRDRFEVWKAPECGKPDAEGLSRHLSHFYGGGTEPYKPLEAAMDLVRGGLKADLLLITDESFGHAPAGFVERVNALKKDPGMRLEVIEIGTGYRGNRPTDEWADKVTRVASMADREEVASALESVVWNMEKP